MKKIVGIVIGIVILLGIVIFLRGGDLFNSNITGYYTNYDSGSADEEIKIPLSKISETATFYEYTSEGVIIKFLVVKAEDGSIKTAFNACDVCFRAKKGYRQEGGYMVCNNCGNRYLISDLGTKNKNPGGCWPGYLPNKIEGSNLVIEKSELEKGRWRFV